MTTIAPSPLLADVSPDAPWELVETFACLPRWKPADVNAAADIIVARLERHGVPVTVHEPEIYLPIPFGAEVRAAGVVYRAKASAYAKSAPDGVEAPLVYVPATYSASIGTLFDTNQEDALQVVLGVVVFAVQTWDMALHDSASCGLA